MSDQTALSYINTVLLAAISVGVGIIYKFLVAMQKNINELQLKVVSLEQFRTGHENWCGDRNLRNEREHTEMQSSIRTLEIRGVTKKRWDEREE